MLVTIDGKLVKVDGGFVEVYGKTPTPPQPPEPPIIDPREGYEFDVIYNTNDIYSTIQSDERVIFITRHAARGNDTSITGDLSATGIQQCKTLGASLHNDNVDLSKSYIGGSVKYRAKNTAYQITKAMGVEYPSDYDYINDTDSYDELLETNFFQDAQGQSSGVDMNQNAYYCYVSEDTYTGPNKIPNLVNTKSQDIIDKVINIANTRDADLCWFGTHDKVIQPLVAYVTDRKNPIHMYRTNQECYVKMTPLPYSGYVGNWSTPLISGIAIIINKKSGKVEIYPIESGL